MTQFTILWALLPLVLGFTSYLLPAIARWSSILTAIASTTYALSCILNPQAIEIQLLDNFGVTLLSDQLGGYFILTNALVTAAVVLYCWTSDRKAYFYTPLMILHGSINAVFIAADLITIYVGLEVISIAAFLLMANAQSDRSLWVGLRYLLVSNAAMLFYLMGAGLVYQSNQSFALAGIQNAPTEAIALLVVGLLVKGGIFVSGLWLPFTHGEVAAPVSAMLSGSVIKAGILPLVRFSLVFPDIVPVLQWFCMGTAILGVTLAIFQTDTKRVLALSTLSQMGFILVNPINAGVYALTHGLAKATLFLMAGRLPSRDIRLLQQSPIAFSCWLPTAIASLSVMGSPGLVGFGSKLLTLKPLTGIPAIAMNVATVGTVLIMSKFLFLPFEFKEDKDTPLVTWFGLGLPLACLVMLVPSQMELYTWSNLQKALLTLAIGWGLYWVGGRKLQFQFPNPLERLEHLIGMMSVALTILFWMALQ